MLEMTTISRVLEESVEGWRAFSVSGRWLVVLWAIRLMCAFQYSLCVSEEYALFYSWYVVGLRGAALIGVDLEIVSNRVVLQSIPE
jgi:hypothetical protein